MVREQSDVGKAAASPDDSACRIDTATVLARPPQTLVRRWLRVAAPESGAEHSHWLLRFAPDGEALAGRTIAFVRLDGVAPKALLALRIGQPGATGFVLPSLRGMRGDWTAAGELMRAIAHMSHLSGLTVDLRLQGLTGVGLQVDLEVSSLSRDAALRIAVRVWPA